MLQWQRLWTSVLNWDPPGQYIPGFAAALSILLVNILACLCLFQLIKHLIPYPVKEYCLDYVKTLVFSTNMIGNGLMRMFYGHPGYFASMVPINTMTFFLFPLGMGSPLIPWMNFIYKVIPWWKLCFHMIAQVLGGISAYYFGRLMFYSELHPVYVEKLHETFCYSDLQVSVLIGALIEMAAVVFDTWLNMQTLSKNVILDVMLKFTNGGILVMMGLRYTGMYMNPAMASGHTFGCGITHPLAHILVYWIGPFVGVYIGILLNNHIYLTWNKTLVDSEVEVPRSRLEMKKEVINGTLVHNGISTRKRKKKKWY